MQDLYTEEELDRLEQEEHSITDEVLVSMFASITSTKTELEKELRSFYQKYGKDGVVTYAEARKWVSMKDRRKRMNVLFLATAYLFSNLLDYLSIDFETMISDVVDKEKGFFKTDIEKISGKWGEGNHTWRDRLGSNVTRWNSTVRSDIKRSILQGKNIDEILTELEDRFGSMQKVLESLAITETTANGSLARKEIFKKLGITKYKFYTRVDERRCEVCGSMHGLIFPMAAYEVGVTASPMHPRCRCWEVPIME